MAESAKSAELFYKRFEPIENLVFSVILSIIRDRDTAFDVLQDTIVLAIRHYDQLQDKEMLKHWVLRIAKNESFTYLRKQRNSKEILAEPEYMAALPAFSAQSVEQTVVSGDDREALNRAIKKLDRVDQLILYLRYHEDMKLTQIAACTGFTLPKVKSRLSRAFKKLRRILETDEN